MTIKTKIEIRIKRKRHSGRDYARANPANCMNPNPHLNPAPNLHPYPNLRLSLNRLSINPSEHPLFWRSHETRAQCRCVVRGSGSKWQVFGGSFTAIPLPFSSQLRVEDGCLRHSIVLAPTYSPFFVGSTAPANPAQFVRRVRSSCFRYHADNRYVAHRRAPQSSERWGVPARQ
jgi:hypothetical protein